jgi:hypothetical protein
VPKFEPAGRYARRAASQELVAGVLIVAQLVLGTLLIGTGMTFVGFMVPRVSSAFAGLVVGATQPRIAFGG